MSLDSFIKKNSGDYDKAIFEYEERKKSENYMETKQNYIRVLESKINDRFSQESEMRKEIERRFSTLIEDKFNALKIEISKESRNR
jgi:hypothetical protein